MGTTALAQTPAIGTGLQFLAASQNLDGSWGGVATSADIVATTAEAVQTLSLLDPTSTSLPPASAWLASQPLTTTEGLASRILALCAPGSDLEPLLAAVDDLMAAWGGTPGYDVNNLDTALALQALAAVHATDDPTIAAALGYLTSTQNLDGGWGLAGGHESNVSMTARVTLALQSYADGYVLDTPISAGTEFLLAQQHGDGGLGIVDSTVGETALAFLVLQRAGAASARLEAAQQYIEDSRLADGSWEGDPLVTALALRALFAAIPSLPASIAGLVQDASSGLPLAGVAVAIIGPTPGQITTLADGSFAFTGLSAGAHSLALSKAGYQSRQVAATVVAGQDLLLGPVSLTALPVPVTGLAGTVTDAVTGLGIAGAQVTVTGSSAAFAVTDSQGAYAVSGLAAGGIIVVFAAPGYLPTTVASTAIAGRVLSLSPALVPEGSAPPPDTTAAVSGLVVDSVAGTGLAGVEVTAAFGYGEETVFTPAGGGFTISGLAAASGTLSFRLPGYETKAYSLTLAANTLTEVGQVALAPAGSAGPLPDLAIAGLQTENHYCCRRQPLQEKMGVWTATSRATTGNSA
ncbi:MAG: carboxypeptidase regulatory-like domain-containing protein [Thermodesulfobacteriota bacterium]